MSSSSTATPGDSGATPAKETIRIGRYEVLDRIGMGGMAEVFRARATGPRGYQRNVIIKRILPHFAAQPDFIRASVADAKLLGMLSPPNLAGSYASGEGHVRT